MRKHESHHLAGFHVAPFRVFAPKTRLYNMAQISYHSFLTAHAQLALMKFPLKRKFAEF